MTTDDDFEAERATALADAKLCQGCFLDKPFAMFARNRSRPDGLERLCRACTSLCRKAFEEDRRVRIDAVRKAWIEQPPYKAIHENGNIGNVIENMEVVALLIYVFAQLGEPSCVCAVSGERHDRQG